MPSVGLIKELTGRRYRLNSKTQKMLGRGRARGSGVVNKPREKQDEHAVLETWCRHVAGGR